MTGEIFLSAKAWLHGCVVTQLEKERKITSLSLEPVHSVEGL